MNAVKDTVDGKDAILDGSNGGNTTFGGYVKETWTDKTMKLEWHRDD